MRRFELVLLLAMAVLMNAEGSAWAQDSAAEEAPAADQSEAELPEAGTVLEVAYRFDGGQYNKTWAGSGTPVAIEHLGQTILDEGTGGTYCCGYTFAVAMITAQERGLLEGKSVKQVKRYQRMWYGAVGDKTARDREIQEKQIAMAMPMLKIGQAIKPADAQPGDFLQFWRTKSGHSVVFLGWIEEDGQPVGVRYRSSQGSTDGIGDKEERFQDHGGRVDPKRMYFARLNEARPE